MIRIDEIYNHCFWPFIQQNIPDTRLFFCDPFGHTGTENLFNFGHDVFEKNFVFCHDQEPVYSDTHAVLFAEVQRRNLDLNHGQGPQHGGQCGMFVPDDANALVAHGWSPEVSRSFSPGRARALDTSQRMPTVPPISRDASARAAWRWPSR